MGSGDEEMERAFLHDALYAMVYRMTKTAMSHHYGARNVIDYEGEVLEARESFERGVKKAMESRFNCWHEYTGVTHVSFNALAGKELRLAIEVRRKRIADEGRIVLFEERVAVGLGDEEVVGEKFTNEELEEMYRKIVIKKEEDA